MILGQSNENFQLVPLGDVNNMDTDTIHNPLRYHHTQAEVRVILGKY